MITLQALVIYHTHLSNKGRSNPQFSAQVLNQWLNLVRYECEIVE